MTEGGCPLCDKPVSGGESALHAHLEFAHGMDDPETWLAELRSPSKSRRGFRRRSREREELAGAPPAPAAELRPEPLRPAAPPPPAPEPAAEPYRTTPPPTAPAEEPEPVRSAAPAPPDPAARPEPEPQRRPEPPRPTAEPTAPRRAWAPPDTGRLREKDAPGAMWSDVEADVEALRGSLFTSEERPETTDSEPETGPVAPGGFRRALQILVALVIGGVAVAVALQVLGDEEPTAVPSSSTTAVDGDGSTEATAPQTPADFRAPFAFDAVLVGCEPDGGEATYEIRFVFSGAKNIVFDDVAYPDRSADGERTTTRTLPVGETSFVDQLTVLDSAGNEHTVTLDPPVFLSGC